MVHHEHANHTHKHSEACGHTRIRHDGHLDYLHDGHLHTQHESHYDEHVIAVGGANPAECKKASCACGHDGCGHEWVPHGDHKDAIVNGRLHHRHGDHCDDHGAVQVER